MNLYLQKVVHTQAHDNYRVILKLDEGEFEIGSIGIQHGAYGLGELISSSRCATWRRRGKARTAGTANQYKAAWERFVADEPRGQRAPE